MEVGDKVAVQLAVVGGIEGGFRAVSMQALPQNWHLRRQLLGFEGTLALLHAANHATSLQPVSIYDL